MKPFVYRKFLNGSKSPSTGAVYAYHGPAPWNPKIKSTFFEVSDCHVSARLHMADIDSVDDFIKKLEKIRDAAEAMIKFLKK